MYTEFGLTYYFSEVLCQGLGIFYALMSFKNINDATRPRLEEKLVEAQSLTLGVVIGKVKPLISISLQTKLDQALEKRNYLAHQFWYEHAYDMAVASGVIKLIAELRQNRELFEKLDNKILELTTQRLKQIGLTEGTIEEYLQRGLAGEIEDPLPLKVPLSKKMVRIIEVYDIVLDNESIALVFLTDDKQFLQFCDIGLGWSNFTQIQPNWKVNNVLKQYLPASIVPRPQVNDPWNYEFNLPKNSVLWVKKGRNEKTFKWGIKAAKK